VIIPQDSIELLTQNGEENSEGHESFLRAINAQGQGDFLYGYDKDTIR
ncbi:MAG: cysteinyl-tRNA synthetase, partial [Arcticibacterium sp.]